MVHLPNGRRVVIDAKAPLDRYLDAVIALDPQFRAVYRYAGTVMMYNLRRIARESIERSNHYLEQGYRKFQIGRAHV